jgi:predicted HicB family RNase H-like nuclease
MLKYKNYLGLVEYDAEGKTFTGEVLGLRDVITFQGRTPEELEDSFRQSIDFYLEMSKSPFDVPSIKLPITKADILEAVRESRASGDRHA